MKLKRAKEGKKSLLELQASRRLVRATLSSPPGGMDFLPETYWGKNHQYYDEKQARNLKYKNKSKIVVCPRTCATTNKVERQEVGTARKCL